MMPIRRNLLDMAVTYQRAAN
jgi:hypothetical protein